MFSSDLWNEKPLYSDVVYIPSFSLMESRFQFSYSPTETTDTDSENDYFNIDLESTSLGHFGNNRFKIDRHKIEKMIETPSNEVGLNSAEHFFNNIMKTTDTFISWPMNIKIGARTRKDPFVHIIGRPNDTAWARGLILASLAARGPLLTMKIIIAENDHLHIMGPTRSNIKTIMEQTDTHIHFPHSTEKSNQVLVYGRIDSLLRAAESLRLSTPLTMSFELPSGIPLSRQDMPDIRQLETDFGVQIIFISILNKSSCLATVKGTHENADKVKEAVMTLVNLICDTEATDTLSNIKLEISKLLFDLSNTENRINLFFLEEKTQTIISVSDPEENGETITITGSIDMIYEVQKEIMSYLPIEFTFDIPDNPYLTTDIMSLGMKYGITVRMQHREKDNNIAVTMRAAEKNMSNIFAAQKEAAEMQNTSRNETEFPKAYFLVQPAYRKALENDISSGSQYEEMLRQIWAPNEPNTERNILPFANPGSSSLVLNLEEIGDISEEQEDLPFAPFSPGTTCSSVDSSQDERLSADWSVMSTVQNDSTFESDFDSEDMEVAFLFMPSTENLSPIFPNAPGAERVCRS